MERRNFFKIAPLGLLGVAALAKGETEPTGSVVMKAKQLTIHGADGKQYHPLVVEVDDATHEAIPYQIPQVTTMSSERLRVTSNGSLGIGTTTPTMQFFYDGNETFRL